MSIIPLPGPVAVRAADDAMQVLGTHEVNGSNSGPEVDQYLQSVGVEPGAPWCAAFVRWRIGRALHELEKEGTAHTLPADFPNSGYVPDYGAWAKEHNLWIPVADVRAGTQKARKGDLLCFWFASMSRLAHIGIVQSWDGEELVSVEANTSDAEGVNRDGGGVYRKVRTLGNLGSGGGFVRLPF